MTRAADILVVGAGPTGLALALQAHAHGARVRIIERRPEAFRPSRALILHPRTLEALRPLGVTEALLDWADIAPEARLYLGSRMVPVRLGELALPDSAFPHMTLMRQMDVETVLAQALAERGVEVERGVEAIDVWDGSAGAGATLRSRFGTEKVDCAFVAGCDGPGSIVRRQAGIAWRGRPYGEEIVLADAELEGDLVGGVAHVVVGNRGLLFVFALGEQATWRLLITRPAGSDRLPFGQAGPPVPADELQALLDDAGVGVRISSLTWSARYQVQHRLAAHFRRGRLFLAGDAAHAFSPASGQGMNTGIQDALNLGWKLAFAASSIDCDALLDSYELERRPVVRRVLAITHAGFWMEASTSPLPSLLRGVLAPLGASAVPFFAGRRRLVAEVIRLISQMRAAYGKSPLSVEGTPRLDAGPRAGHRLPDATVISSGHSVRLHSLLATPGVHVLLHRDAESIEHLDFGPHVTVHRLTSIPGPGLVAVRPDGYVGFRCGITDVAQLRGWLTHIGGGTVRDGNGRQARIPMSGTTRPH